MAAESVPAAEAGQDARPAPATAAAEEKEEDEGEGLDALSDTAVTQIVEQGRHAAEAAFHARVRDLVHLAAPVVLKARQAREAVDRTYEEAQGKATSLVRTKAAVLVDRVLDALRVDMATRETLVMLGGMADNGQPADESRPTPERIHDRTAVPLSALLAAVLVPARLRLWILWSKIQLALCVPMVLLLVAALVLDFDERCPEKEPLQCWAMGYAALLLAEMGLRSSLVASASRDLGLAEELQAQRQASDDSDESATEQWLDSTARVVDSLERFDALAGCFASRALDWAAVVAALWGAAATLVCVLHAPELRLGCEARWLYFAVNGYAALYVMGLPYTVPRLVVWLELRFLTHHDSALGIVRAAKRFDMEEFFGLPVATICARIFLLQDMPDIREAEIAHLKSELETVQADDALVQEEITQVQAELQERRRELQERCAASDAACATESKAGGAFADVNLLRADDAVALLHATPRLEDLTTAGEAAVVHGERLRQAGAELGEQLLEQAAQLRSELHATTSELSVDDAALRALQCAKDAGIDVEALVRRMSASAEGVTAGDAPMKDLSDTGEQLTN